MIPRPAGPVLRTLLWRLLPLVLVCSGCMSAHPPLSDQTPEKGRTYSVQTSRSDLGLQRNYLLHVPQKWDGESPLPVVVALHGAFMTGGELENRSGLSHLADEQGFAVLYPQGVGLMGWLQHWNAGFCCGKAMESGVDDLHFLDVCLADAGTRLPVDKGRIYLMGLSNGGMLAYHYALHGRRKVAGVAVIAGAMDGAMDGTESSPSAQGVSPVPVLMIHGLEDTHLPYEGGRFRNGDDGPVFLPQLRAADFWTGVNGCSGKPELLSTHDGKVKEMRWEACSSGAGVRLYSLEGFGHAWAGGDDTAHLPPQGGELFDAAALAWQWLGHYRRGTDGALQYEP